MRTSTLAYLSSALLLALTVLACQKPEIETIRLHGSVVNQRNAQLIEGVTLTLQSAVLENGIFHNQFEDIATTTTNGNGGYSFETSTQKAVTYRVVVSADGYFETQEDFDPFDITTGESVQADFVILPAAWLRLDVSNVSPWNADDQVTWSLNGEFQACFDCCGSGIKKGTGPLFSTSDVCRLVGDQWLLLSWTVTKNNSTKNHTDSLWIASFDTIPYQINY